MAKKKQMGALEQRLDEAVEAVVKGLETADLTRLQGATRVHRTSMYDILKGKTSPSVRTLAKLAKGLDEAAVEAAETAPG